MKKEEHVQRALSLAKKGRTSPNPKVGAVLVKKGKIIAEGYHKKAGMPHAEVEALGKAGENAKGATLYVTLEPCSHFGKTPPCTDAIIEAGVEKVVCAMRDPNPMVKGIEKLKKAGVEVETGVLKKEAEIINEKFIKFIKTGMPFITVKCALSIDGKIATRKNDSKWISGKEARKFSHGLRDEHDAILVGINTVIEDDPKLTARIKDGRDPARVVLDSRLKIPLGAKLLENGKAIIATSEMHEKGKRKKLEKAGAKVLVCGKKRVNLKKLMKLLAKREITSILIEGGGETIGSAFDKKIVNKAYFVVAPLVIGGKDAVASVGGRGAGKIEDAIKLKEAKMKKMGNDFVFEGYPSYRDLL